MRSVGSHSTSGKDKKGIKERGVGGVAVREERKGWEKGEPWWKVRKG